jgi:hypothetical protein
MKYAKWRILIVLLFVSTQIGVAQNSSRSKRSSPAKFTINRECDGGACHFQIISFRFGRNFSIAAGVGRECENFSLQIENGKSLKEFIYHNEPRPHFLEKDSSWIYGDDRYCTHVETSEKAVDDELSNLLLDVYQLGHHISENDVDTRNKTYSETGRFSVLTNLRSYLTASKPFFSTTESGALTPSKINPEQKPVWIELDRGTKTGQFQFSPNRTLLYAGRPITGIRFKSTVQRIAVSPTAVGGKYAICVAFDDMDSAAYLVQLYRHSGKRLALHGPPSVWTAWAPAGTHAVIGSYYEADETLYSISLPSGIVRRFSFKLAKQTEEESYDLDNLAWIDNRVFRLRVKIHCNPYTNDNCSDQDRETILREYEVKANIATLAVSPERLR